jgi:hypothetical protein
MLDQGYVRRQVHPSMPLAIYNYTEKAAAYSCIVAVWRHQRNTFSRAGSNSVPTWPTSIATCAGTLTTWPLSTASAGGPSLLSLCGIRPNTTSRRLSVDPGSLAAPASPPGSSAFVQFWNQAKFSSHAKMMSAANRPPLAGSASITVTPTCGSRASSRASRLLAGRARSARTATGSSTCLATRTRTGTGALPSTGRSWRTSLVGRCGGGSLRTTRTGSGWTIGPRILSYGSSHSHPASAQAIWSRGHGRSSPSTAMRSTVVLLPDLAPRGDWNALR